MRKTPLVFLTIAAVAAGCGGGAARPVAQPISNTPEAPAQPERRLEDDLAAMPVETEMVFAVDFAQLRASDAFKRYEPLVREKLGKGLEELRAKCGFDPMTELTSMLMGSDLPQGGSPNHATVFLRGFGKEPTLACLRTAAAESRAKGENKTVNIDGGYVELVDHGAIELRGMFVDDSTFLFIKEGDDFAGKGALAAAAEARDGAGLTSSAAFRDLLRHTKTDATGFYIVNGNAPAIASSALPYKLKAIVGWVDARRTVAGELRMRMISEADANGMLALAKMAVGQLHNTVAGRFVEPMQLASKGNDLIATFEYTTADIEAMVELAGY